jgi:hypothetical protein
MKLFSLKVELLHSDREQLFHIIANDKTQARQKVDRWAEENGEKVRTGFYIPREMTGILIQ